MTSLTAPTVWARTVAQALRTVLAAWRGIGWREVRNAMLLGVGLFAYHLGTGVALGGGLRFGAIVFMADQIRALAFLLAVVVADRVTGRDPDRRGTYTLAVVVGAAAGAVASLAAVKAVMAAMAQHGPPGIGFVLYVFFDLLLLGGAAVWVMNDRRRAQRERDRMHKAELERVAAAKRSIESDLQAMQARVEPQFLFNTLAQVKRLYEQDVARGERMLDELIAYLRAAMPRMRDTSSTVGQEMELVRAYLGIVRVRLGERLAFAIEPLAASVAAARLPPMMLLPLVDHAIVHGLEPSNGAGTIDVRAEAVGGRLRLRIADSGAGFVAQEIGEGIDGIRERLQALFGSDGRLDLRPRERGAAEALLDIPFEVGGETAVETTAPGQTQADLRA